MIVDMNINGEFLEENLSIIEDNVGKDVGIIYWQYKIANIS